MDDNFLAIVTPVVLIVGLGDEDYESISEEQWVTRQDIKNCLHDCRVLFRDQVGDLHDVIHSSSLLSNQSRKCRKVKVSRCQVHG